MSERQKRRGPKQMGKTLKALLSYLKDSRLTLVVVVFSVVLSVLAGVAGTYFIRPLINDFIETKDVLGMAQMIGVIAIIYVIGTLSNYLSSRLMIGIGQKTIERMRYDLFNHIETLPIRYFDTNKHGDIMSRFTNDFETIQNMFNNSFLLIVTSVLQVVSTFVMMVLLSPWLTVLFVALVGLMLYLVGFVGKRSAKYFGQQQQRIGTLNGFVEEYIEGQKVVKVFNREDNVLQQFDQLNQELNSVSTQAQFYAFTMFPILGNLSFMNYALTAMLGGMLVVSGSMDIGALASFLQYSRAFAQPLGQISQQMNIFFSAMAGAERIFSILKEQPEEDEGTVVLDKSDDQTWYWVDGDKRSEVVGNITLTDVDFGYQADRQILKHINVWAKPGLKVAFVGATGAGKTTIINLLNRFYDVANGEITFDGIPIRRIKKDDLRQTISIVLQDTHLFTGSVADNIRYGRLDASDDDVIRAAKLANAHSFIKRLPNGYKTQLTGDGDGLSQGQRQLLAIARAAVANPKVLILDEATSSIDSHTEALISQGMDQLMHGRTSFVIAHRLSTIRNADVIMVMDKGEIIERGNHEELMQKQGTYYKLYTGQIELD